MNKTILITGGSRGIGRATAEKFLENGWTVISTSTSGEFDYSHKNLITHKYDQSNSKSISDFVSWFSKEGYKIDVLINNAGIMLDWMDSLVDIATLRKTAEVNLFGLVELTENILGYVNEGGLIINISSGLGALGEDMGTLAPTYSITKAGLNMYTKRLNSRVVSEGISVISYEPGWVKTDMGGEQAPREVGEPAKELYDLATMDPKPEGGLFYNGDGVRSW